MFVKTLAVVVMTLAGTAACAGPDSESDDAEENTSSTASSIWREDTPQPFDNDLRAPSLKRDFREWDPRSLERELREDRRWVNCAVRVVKIYDPARQKEISVDVTTCN